MFRRLRSDGKRWGENTEFTRALMCGHWNWAGQVFRLRLSEIKLDGALVKLPAARGLPSPSTGLVWRWWRGSGDGGDASGQAKIYSFNFLFVGFASHLFPLLKKSVAFVRPFVSGVLFGRIGKLVYRWPARAA